MPGSMERPRLHVEGPDDQHSIVHLLGHHGVDYHAKPWAPELPQFQQTGGVRELLEGIEIAVRLSTGRVIGFVLDADSPLHDRWQAVRDRLTAVGVVAPQEPLPQGFIGESKTFRSRVGVWLMPDNQHDGKLETFLETLISEHDPLIDHAKGATDKAKDLGAEFAESDRRKASLHAWLAWQEEPGRPYGTAIRARYFRHDSAVARVFVAWFKNLFRIG